jgi:hypothetical protein
MHLKLFLNKITYVHSLFAVFGLDSGNFDPQDAGLLLGCFFLVILRQMDD